MSNVLFERKDHVGILTVSRPEALNALNMEVLSQLEAQLMAIEECVGLRAIVITGDGKAFVAGADIGEMRDMDTSAAYEFANMGDRVFTRLERLPIPVIAAINGYALGGGLELALSCDIRIASNKAVFGQPETSLGITPGFGGTQRLSRTVGMAKAMEMILTAGSIRSDEALRIGLVNLVTEPERLMETALDMAEKIAQNAPVAVREAKSSIRQFWCADIYTDLEYEAGAFSRCFSTQDQKIGMTSFLEKKPHDEYKGE